MTCGGIEGTGSCGVAVPIGVDRTKKVGSRCGEVGGPPSGCDSNFDSGWGSGCKSDSGAGSGSSSGSGRGSWLWLWQRFGFGCWPKLVFPFWLLQLQLQLRFLLPRFGFWLSLRLLLLLRFW